MRAHARDGVDTTTTGDRGLINNTSKGHTAERRGTAEFKDKDTEVSIWYTDCSLPANDDENQSIRVIETNLFNLVVSSELKSSTQCQYDYPQQST